MNFERDALETLRVSSYGCVLPPMDGRGCDIIFHEPYIYNPKREISEKKDGVELSKQCKLDNKFMTTITHKSDKYCIDYYYVNLNYTIINTMVIE